MRRAAALLLLPALLGGCLGQTDDAPTPTVPTDAEPTPEDACAARGILPPACEVFCTLNPETCGLPPQIPDPYPPAVTLPAPTLPAPTLPSAPTLDGTAPALPDVCGATGACGGA